MVCQRKYLPLFPHPAKIRSLHWVPATFAQQLMTLSLSFFELTRSHDRFPIELSQASVRLGLLFVTLPAMILF